MLYLPCILVPHSEDRELSYLVLVPSKVVQRSDHISLSDKQLVSPWPEFYRRRSTLEPNITLTQCYNPLHHLQFFQIRSSLRSAVLMAIIVCYDEITRRYPAGRLMVLTSANTYLDMYLDLQEKNHRQHWRICGFGAGPLPCLSQSAGAGQIISRNSSFSAYYFLQNTD